MWCWGLEIRWDGWDGAVLKRGEEGLNFSLDPYIPFGHQMQNEGCHFESLKPNPIPRSETSIPAMS